MIAQVNTLQRKKRFQKACRNKWCLGAQLPLEWELFGKSQPWRFYAAPTLALELSGSTAWAAGHAGPEELASFLHFCGCESVILDETECPPPAGWKRAESLTIFGLEPGEQLSLPPADESLWAELVLDTEPSAREVAEFLCPDELQRRDDFYSELCTKRTRGKAFVWALRQNGTIVCTVGTYSLHAGQGYMACGQTAEALRSRGVGGRLIVQMANTLARQGNCPVFLCKPERVRLYTRLGFHKLGELARYQSDASDRKE